MQTTDRTITEVQGMWGDAFRYDAECACPAGDSDKPFWQRLIAETGARRVLELGCGTGRLIGAVTDTLRNHGGGVYVGVDLSDGLLAAARPRAHAASDETVSARVERMDIRALRLPETFDLVIIPYNTLAYLHGRDDQLACLNGLRALLAPGGRLAFDVLTPRPALIAQTGAPPWRLELDHAAPEYGLARFQRSSADTYDPATQTLESYFIYDLFYLDGRHERRAHDLRWHFYFPAELELLLDRAGLTVTDRYGSYEREPWNADSRQYMWVCAAA